MMTEFAVEFQADPLSTWIGIQQLEDLANEVWDGLKVGFTGTRAGMTLEQMETVRLLLYELYPSEFHHGDCFGADEDADGIARSLDIPTYHHPSTLNKQRAWCPHSTRVFDVKKPLDRNQDIVDATSVLIATPRGYLEENRSGTWSTVRRARKRNRILVVIGPNGKEIP